MVYLFYFSSIMLHLIESISTFPLLQAHASPNHRPLLCPRFLSHMKTRPEYLRPPCFLSSKSRPQPPSQGKTQNTNTLTALKTQTLEGEAYQQNTWCFHTTSDLSLDVKRGGGMLTPLTPLIKNFSRLFFLSWSSGG